MKTALAIYAADAERVAGEAPARCDAPGNAVVVVGSLSEPERLDPLLRAWGVSAKAVEGRWEAFRICEAFRNGERALWSSWGAIRAARLTACWSFRACWAFSLGVVGRRDTAPLPDGDAFTAGYDRTEAPSVQYRGIFLNDEDWGLDPWGARYEGSGVAGELGRRPFPGFRTAAASAGQYALAGDARFDRGLTRFPATAKRPNATE